MSVYHAAYAWIGGRVARDVLIETADGRITAVTPNLPAAGQRLPGLVLPGFANAHSHAFHRALRGRTHGEQGSFWTWRELMYRIAGRLDPDNYFALARAVYAEMALAGITCVGEFHYLHHGPDGVRYADPNAMGRALLEAAREAGLRITLLDTVYLTAGVDGGALEGVQRRFGDGDVDGWADRVAGLTAAPHARIGAAIHSVRAVPAEQLAAVVASCGIPAGSQDPLRPAESALRASRALAAGSQDPIRPAESALRASRPLHVHLSEQRAENEQCRAAHGCTPAQLLDRHGVLGPDTTVVHATHLTDEDVKLLGRTRTGACFCPTTERDLADGIGPARRLADAGSPLSLGSDSHAVIDPFEEARAVETHERLATERRGHFTAAELVAAAANHAALGWTDAGTIAPGQRADLVAVSLDSARTAGIDPDGLVFAATAADVTDVIIDGRSVVRGGRHTSIDVPAALRDAIAAVLR